MSTPSQPGVTVALGATTVAAGLSFARFFTGDRWAVPVVLTAIAAHAASWWLRRRRIRTRWAVPAALVVVAAVATASAVPSSTTGGQRLAAAASVGLVAVLADWATFRAGAALQGLAPAVVIIGVCQYLGGSTHRTLLLALDVATITTFLRVHRSAVDRQGVQRLPAGPTPPARWLTLAGPLAAVVLVVLAVGVGALLPGSAPHAGPRSVPGPVPSVHHRGQGPSRAHPLTGGGRQPAPATTPSPLSTPRGDRQRSGGSPHAGPPVWLVLLIALASALVLWVGVNLMARRLRWRRRRRAVRSAADGIAVAWIEVTEHLRWCDLGARPRPLETRREFAERTGRGDDLVALAAGRDRVAFAGHPPAPDAGVAALEMATRIGVTLDGEQRWPGRLARAFDPRWGWSGPEAG